MQRWSRRRTLQAVAATATVALAGCSDSTERSDTVPSGHDGRPVTDYDAEMVRDPEGRPLFWRTQDGEPDPDREGIVLLTDPLTESEVTVASDVPAAATLKSFAAETDFETESVLLYATRISGCHALKLQSVGRQEEDGAVDDVEISLCRSYRPADVSCDTDTDQTAGVGVRLPFPGDDVNGTGMRISSTCRDRPEPVLLGGDDG